jgi:hypothetical protein
MENIKIQTPFKELKDSMGKSHLPISLIKQMSQDFGISYSTLKRKDVENFFSKDEKLSELLSKDQLTHEEI